MTSFETIRVEPRESGVIRLTLARPEKHNAINAAMIDEITRAIGEIRGDGACRVLLLAADGGSFCAGGDLQWMRGQFEASRKIRMAEAAALQAMLTAIDTLPQLVIARVQGPVYGGGLGLLAACDVVVANAKTVFALTETRLGLIPATISPFLHRRIGAAALRRLGLHGPAFDVATACAIGLVSEVAADLDAAVGRHVQLALECAPGAVAAAKALYRGIEAGDVSAADTIRHLADRWEADEARAGIESFFKRSPPPWSV